MISIKDMHVLALDVRHSRLGYALFEGPNRLLDWGISGVPPRCNDRVGWTTRRMTALLRYSSPEMIIVKRPIRGSKAVNPSQPPILGSILEAIRAQTVPVAFLEIEDIRAAFRVFEARRKDDVASILVQMFPELFYCLPARRKKWQSEPHRMILFDAISVGFAYWQRTPAV
jgi:hypothetical protein